MAVDSPPRAVGAREHRVEIRHGEIDVLGVVAHRFAIAIGHGVVDRENDAAALEVVPARRHAEARLLEERAVKSARLFEIRHRHDDAEESNRGCHAPTVAAGCAPSKTAL